MIAIPQKINKKWVYGILGLLLAYSIVRSVVAAAGRPLWYDELLTLTVSLLETWQARMTALRLPLDGQPPLFYLIEHFALRLVRNEEVALRLPSILAFALAATSVFVYAKKRGGEIIALLCTFALLLTNLFDFYAIEARPYSMAVACVAFALVCYQRTPSLPWTVLLAVSLALAESFHHFSVLAMIPFGLAEAALFLRTRQIRWQVWAALAVGALPLLFQWQLLQMNKAYFGSNFWAKFQIYFFPSTYGEFLGTSARVGAGATAVVLAAVIGRALWREGVETNGDTKTEDWVEATLLVALVTLPFVGYALTSLMHSGFTGRYVESTVLGLVLSFGFILSGAKKSAVVLFAIFVFTVFGLNELHFWRFARHDIQEVKTGGLAVQKFVEDAGYKDLPVVVPDGFTFVKLAHYGPTELTRRLVFIVPEHSPDDVNWTDTLYKGIELLSSYWPIRVFHSPEFLATNRRFLLYEQGEQIQAGWPIRQYVIGRGSLCLVATDGTRALYLGTSKEAVGAQ